MRYLFAALLSLLSAASASCKTPVDFPTADAVCGTMPAVEEIRFDHTYALACHNCYEPQYAPTLAWALDRVRAIEIDFWDDKNALPGGEMSSNWYVRHDVGGGNNSNCSAPGHLRACLGDIRRWSLAHPRHEPLTIFLDKKQGWGDTRRPHDLDAVILSYFPRHDVFTPADLRLTHASARDAARAKTWPSIGALRGKVVFILTGGAPLRPSASQNEYLLSRGASAVMFVAPDASESNHIVGTPAGYDDAVAGWIVFYNLGKDETHLAAMVRQRGYIARTWGVPESDAGFRQSVGNCANFVALYHVDRPPYYGGRLSGALVERATLHHHHKRGNDCPHGHWATSEAQGHHHHKRGVDCEHGEWATDDVAGHHHHKRQHDCEHGLWATDDRVRP